MNSGAARNFLIFPYSSVARGDRNMDWGGWLACPGPTKRKIYSIVLLPPPAMYSLRLDFV